MYGALALFFVLSFFCEEFPPDLADLNNGKDTSTSVLYYAIFHAILI
jgi:hypothetical protein